MATNLASFSPTIDLSSLERALSKASALSDRTPREMQKNVEAFNTKYLKSVGEVADSSLDISRRALDRFQSAYAPPSWEQAVQDAPERPYGEALRKQHASAELEVATPRRSWSFTLFGRSVRGPPITSAAKTTMVANTV